MKRSAMLALVVWSAGTMLVAAEPIDPKAFARLNLGEIVFEGTIADVKQGPTGLSDPPLLSYMLSFENVTNFRGSFADKTVFRYQIRTNTPPAFAKGQKFIVAARLTEKNFVVDYIVVSGDKLKDLAKEAGSLPLGWAMDEGKLVSPFASLEKFIWPKGEPIAMGPVCTRTGRPALTCGKDVEVTSEQVKAENPKKFQNDMFGDGKFKLTVRNKSDKPAKIYALLTDGKTIFWDDSVVVVYNNGTRLLGRAGKGIGFKPVELKPGESVSGIIDTLPLKNIEWPRGGSRIYFQFALGEKSTSNFFYYFSKLHDPMREEALKKLDSAK